VIFSSEPIAWPPRIIVDVAVGVSLGGAALTVIRAVLDALGRFFISITNRCAATAVARWQAAQDSRELFTEEELVTGEGSP
jgi:hypothetical protein